jgi:hypothetical protein
MADREFRGCWAPSSPCAGSCTCQNVHLITPTTMRSGSNNDMAIMCVWSAGELHSSVVVAEFELHE